MNKIIEPNLSNKPLWYQQVNAIAFLISLPIILVVGTGIWMYKGVEISALREQLNVKDEQLKNKDIEISTLIEKSENLKAFKYDNALSVIEAQKKVFKDEISKLNSNLEVNNKEIERLSDLEQQLVGLKQEVLLFQKIEKVLNEYFFPTSGLVMNVGDKAMHILAEPDLSEENVNKAITQIDNILRARN